MKKGNAKLPLKAMSIAMNNFTEKRCREQGLSNSQTNKILTSVKYEEPYMNLEVFKTGKIYESSRKMGNKVINHIASQKEEN